MNNVLVIGDVMLDHYLMGECSRISPEAPVPVVNIKNDEWRLGGAANVANNLEVLKTNCTLIGVYGDDESANQFDFLLRKCKFIHNKLLRSNARETIVKSRVLVGGHQMIRLDRENAFYLNKEEERAILNLLLDEVEKANVILISDYCKGTLSKHILERIFEMSKAFNKPTIVDPKLTDFSLYKGASFIKPNKKEAEQATGIRISDFETLEKASKRIQTLTDAKAVITTLSEDGVALYMDDCLKVIPTKAKKVFDVTGAGDTYLAAFSYQYLHSSNVIEACEFANFAAGVVVSKIGSSTVSLHEINQIRTDIFL